MSTSVFEDFREVSLSEPVRLSALVTAFFASFSGLLVGYDVGICNGALRPISNQFELNLQQKQVFISLQNWLAIGGCFVGNMSADRCGRRRTIGLYCLFFIVGNGLLVSAPHFVFLCLGRSVAGIAIGMALVVEPVYTAEVSPARLRGLLSSNVEFSYNIGILLGFLSSWGFKNLSDDVSWRYMFGAGLIFPIASLTGVALVIPESPRWLVGRGRIDEARVVLFWLLSPKEASLTFDKLVRLTDCRHDESHLSWRAMIASKTVGWSLVCGCSVAFFSQAGGVETVMYYSGIYLEEAGMTRHAMLIFMVILGAIKLLFIAISGCFVDFMGRRPLLMISCSVMGFSMLCIGFSFHFSLIVWLKLAPLITFIAAFSLGVGPIVYILNGELYPRNCRVKGVAAAMITGRMTSAAVAMSFLSLAQAITTGGVFFCYAALNFMGALFVAYVLPETKGTVLEDKDEGLRQEIELGTTKQT